MTPPSMKQTVTFRTRSKAEVLRDRVKAAAPGAFTSIYVLRGRYALTVSGDAPDDIITRCTK